jgi:hypothetical protein
MSCELLFRGRKKRELKFLSHPSEDKNKVGSTVQTSVEAGCMKTEVDYETTQVTE